MLVDLYHSQGCGSLKTLDFVSATPLGILCDVNAVFMPIMKVHFSVRPEGWGKATFKVVM